MNFTIKKIILVWMLVLLQGCIVVGSEPDKCDVKEIKVVNIYEGGVKDIIFEDPNGDFYYINRGLEQGYTLDGMQESILNKKVTLHLARTLVGKSNHIAQLALENDIVYTEFSKETLNTDN